MARALPDSSSLAQTQIGTPYYLSPEVCESRPYNHKSDIWALGCLIHEICTWSPPFPGKNLANLVNRIMNGKPEPFPKGKYSNQLQALVLRMLQKDSNQRPSASDLLLSLRSFKSSNSPVSSETASSSTTQVDLDEKSRITNEVSSAHAEVLSSSLDTSPAIGNLGSSSPQIKNSANKERLSSLFRKFASSSLSSESSQADSPSEHSSVLPSSSTPVKKSPHSYVIPSPLKPPPVTSQPLFLPHQASRLSSRTHRRNSQIQVPQATKTTKSSISGIPQSASSPVDQTKSPRRKSSSFRNEKEPFSVLTGSASSRALSDEAAVRKGSEPVTYQSRVLKDFSTSKTQSPSVSVPLLSSSCTVSQTGSDLNPEPSSKEVKSQRQGYYKNIQSPDIPTKSRTTSRLSAGSAMQPRDISSRRRSSHHFNPVQASMYMNSQIKEAEKNGTAMPKGVRPRISGSFSVSTKEVSRDLVGERLRRVNDNLSSPSTSQDASYFNRSQNLRNPKKPLEDSPMQKISDRLAASESSLSAPLQSSASYNSWRRKAWSNIQMLLRDGEKIGTMFPQ